MNTAQNPAHGATAVEARAGRTEPVRPVRHATVDETMIEPTRPVDGWGFANRVMIAAAVLTTAFMIARVVLFPEAGTAPVRDLNLEQNGFLPSTGETGRGWVVTLQSVMFGLVGGALTAAFGYGIVLMMGGAARSAARYVIGGVIGGLIAAALLLMVFSNTAVESIGFHVFWLLPLGGLIGGLWAGRTSARR
ncbi:hypothetical protein V3N95_03125 [Micrococcaceae bacterium Sec6.3]